MTGLSANRLVMTSKGTQTRYKKADLEYDKQKQFITLPDMTKKETTQRENNNRYGSKKHNHSRKMSGDVSINLNKTHSPYGPLPSKGIWRIYKEYT